MSTPNLSKSEPLIELKGASKSFGDNLILDEVDLTIYPRDALVLLGPSGTGKSTILRLIAGLIPLDKGTIYFKGRERQGLIEDHIEKSTAISLVFQQSALFDSLTVGQNVGFVLYEHSQLSHSQIEELVEEKLQMVGLPKTSHLYPSELSGGMRKRVSFARAIMNNPENPRDNPEIILYDEPTAGLDPIASTVIEDLVVDLYKQEICSSYVMVTHQSSTIRRTSGTIIFLYQGKIQWQGTYAEYESTNNELVRQFFDASITGPIKVN
ncbi:MAG: ATP-binding cassette domain-containing protein [Gloeocapsa sp. DLM2.Bin57]|nr:MAG: ATP-binding cassette domain-containing protein [Gloeocapsa sp. DLM2.Bin57]